METKSVLELRAGPLTMIFDPSNAFLRHIRWGGQELVRAIYGAIRDDYWNTLNSEIVNVRSQIKNDAFHITFDALGRTAQGEQYFWRGTVTGDASGKITYVFDGEARAEFLRNRIGLCVLHPIEECADRPCMIEHVDGSREMGTFPKRISPEQPFFDIRAVNYGNVEVRFDGEVFEMEDQRNWGDASYKTYSTPQRLPKPVQVRPGDKVRHEVTVRFHQEPRIWIADTPKLPFPQIGRRFDSDSYDHPPGTQVAVVPSALARLGKTVTEKRHEGLIWIVYGNDEITDMETLNAAREVLGPDAALAGGTRWWFVDLNTTRPPKEYPAMLAYRACPQVHQPDDMTVIENIAGMAYAPETAKEFSPRPVVITVRGGPNRTELEGPWVLGVISRLSQTGNVYSIGFERHCSDFFESLLDEFTAFKPVQVLPTRSSQPLKVEALAIVNAQGNRIVLVANFTQQNLTVQVNDQPKTLPPLSVSRL